MRDEPNKDGRVPTEPGSSSLRSPASVSAVSAHTGDDPSRGLIVKRWEVTVRGYGCGRYIATTRGKALADAWRSDTFNGHTFGEFLKFARCRRDRITPPRWGDEITVNGRRALFLGNNLQYVQFVYPNKDVVLNSHPYDVLPVEYRPSTYRDRDSDGSPKGGDGEAGSVRSTTARAEGIAQTLSPSNPEKLSVVERLTFLETAARYFESRPTRGEDLAHWANVYNAQNCRDIAALLLSLQERLDKLEAASKVSRPALQEAERWLDWCIHNHDAPDPSCEIAALARIRKARSALSPQTREGDNG